MLKQPVIGGFEKIKIIIIMKCGRGLKTKTKFSTPIVYQTKTNDLQAAPLGDKELFDIWGKII